MRTHSAVSSDISYFKCISDIKKYLAPPTSLNMSHFALFFLKTFISQLDTTRSQINDTFLFQRGVKVKVVGEVSEK